MNAFRALHAKVFHAIKCWLVQASLVWAPQVFRIDPSHLQSHVFCSLPARGLKLNGRSNRCCSSSIFRVRNTLKPWLSSFFPMCAECFNDRMVPTLLFVSETSETPRTTQTVCLCKGVGVWPMAVACRRDSYLRCSVTFRTLRVTIWRKT